MKLNQNRKSMITVLLNKTHLVLTIFFVFRYLISAGSATISGPDYIQPYLVTSGSRQAPVLMSKSFDNIDMPYFQCGNKKVTVRERNGKLHKDSLNSFGIYINEKEVCRIFISGSYLKDGKWTSVVKNNNNSALHIDKSNNTITYTNPYIRPDGQNAVFSYVLKAAKDGKVVLSWNSGISQEEYTNFNHKNRLNIGIAYSLEEQYRTKGLLINGKQYPKLSKQDVLEKNSTNIVDVYSMSYNPSEALNGFDIFMPASLFIVSERYNTYTRKDDTYSLYIRSHTVPPLSQGEINIDLKETVDNKRNAYPVVGGVDFWAEDAIHYPKSPTKNLIPNSGFEQGLRYWKWGTGGAQYTPSDIKRFDVADGGLFGRKMLVINPVQQGSMPMSSFSMPSEKGKSYTISYYAKAEDGGNIKLWPFSTQTGGKFTRSGSADFPYEKLTKEWQRFSYTIKGDGQMYALWLYVSGRGKVFVDGIQVEEGDIVTDYAARPVEGYLRTSDSDNNIEYGNSVDAVMEFTVADNVQGQVEITLRDFYKKELYKGTFSISGGEEIELPFNELDLGTGVYSVKAKYMVSGFEPYYDYYRFSILKSLNGSHKTKTLFGQLFNSRISRADDYQALIKRYGFGGATTYGAGKINDPEGYKLREKYGVIDYMHTMSIDMTLTKEQRKKRLEDPDFSFYASIQRMWLRDSEKKKIVKVRKYTPEMLAKIEADAERVAREHDYVRAWSFGTEEETSYPAVKEKDFKEFAKLQLAFYRGIKRGNPDALVYPTGGTSGYAAWRGSDIINGYLDATRGKVKWDGVPVHPYGACDKTCGYDDLDEALKLLRDNMAERGYGKDTPILLTEGGIGTPNTTFKGGNVWDYTGGHLSYDFGLREFVNSSRVARGFIICLKYWPQLEHYNIWWTDGTVLLDQELALNAAMNAINTLGHFFDDPEFVGDIRPAPKMRGYAFRNKEGKGVAAVWATSDEVDNGVSQGPVMYVKFRDKLKLYDLMGRQWPLITDKDGFCQLQLTAAPLFLRGGNPERLAEDLNNAEIRGAGGAIKLEFKPEASGNVLAVAQNVLNRTQNAVIQVNNQKFNTTIPGMTKKIFTVDSGYKACFGKIFKWQGDYSIEQAGEKEAAAIWNMDYFYVPYVMGEPDWETIPAIKMTNLYRPVINTKQTPGGHPGDIEAIFKIAWNSSNLYLRVEAEDDIFNVDNKKFWTSEQAQKTQLYILDGCLEVYIDCAANGRTGTGGFDLDDYRYDFCAGNPEGKDGPGLVNRLREPFTEYALGVEMPSKEEVRQKVKCSFKRISDEKYIYTITLNQRYLEPMSLKEGTIAGFALYLHDRMDDGTLGNKGISLATEAGKHCDNNPKIWPLIYLAK